MPTKWKKFDTPPEPDSAPADADDEGAGDWDTHNLTTGDKLIVHVAVAESVSEKESEGPPFPFAYVIEVDDIRLKDGGGLLGADAEGTVDPEDPAAEAFALAEALDAAERFGDYGGLLIHGVGVDAVEIVGAEGDRLARYGQIEVRERNADHAEAAALIGFVHAER